MAACTKRHGALRNAEGLTEVERLMRRLACEPTAGPAGQIAYEHLATGGKRLRARLALAAVEALGGDRHRIIPWAAACELLHNATLVHDDLQDGDGVRRGQPAAWVRHGPAQAVNAGDLMLMLPFLAIDEVPASPELRWSLAITLATHATRVVRGQAAEFALAGSGQMDWECYLGAVAGKTSALFQLPVEGAALVSGSSPAEAQGFASGFRHLGVLFQLQDDVLDLFGEKGRDAPGSDLREGKISALVIEHLALHAADAEWLLALLACPRDETCDADVESAMERFRNGGALDGVLARIEREVLAAVNSPVLASIPALQELASELVEVALAPIEHLRSPRPAR
jgi:geranylgeranyl diphosphate synthase type I